MLKREEKGGKRERLEVEARRREEVCNGLRSKLSGRINLTNGMVRTQEGEAGSRGRRKLSALSWKGVTWDGGHYFKPQALPPKLAECKGNECAEKDALGAGGTQKICCQLRTE